ncbi:response regulator [Dechloromonas sp. HYN0024]|uniref:response regulator n=1 Tax=Dechloromonas sp. HYN0024 TaxID=2231055 RepID=UPI0013C37389|nr:response regulator [Dechloromonas sp. HYN0024]
MSAGPWRVLFADDDPTAGFLVRAALGGGDFALTVVDNGNDALARLEASPFDMALLDVEMPGLDGLAVCSAIRRRYGAGFPVLLVTGRTDPAFVEQAERLSATRLSKPVDWAGLADRLRTMLGSPPR